MSPGIEEAPLKPLADGVWVESEPVRFLGMRLTSTMTVLRLPDESLLVHSPVRMTAGRRAQVEALGRVTHLYAPNLFHHLHLGDWIATFPSARVHTPKGLEAKRPDLRRDRVQGAGPEPAFAGVIDELHVDGFRLEESVLFHRPSRTLVVADLIHNIGRPEHGWTKFYTRTMGFYDTVALSRVIRWTAFDDRKAARRSVDSILSLPFERVVVGHGPPLGAESRDAMVAAYSWLRTA